MAPTTQADYTIIQADGLYPVNILLLPGLGEANLVSSGRQSRTRNLQTQRLAKLQSRLPSDGLMAYGRSNG